MELRGFVDHVAWPAVMTGLPAELMALQRQFDATQWLPPDQLRANQFRQLGSLLVHAARTVPFYADRLRAAGVDPASPLTGESWARIPVLTRRDVQSVGPGLHSNAVPPSHGALTEVASGGSTGIPVRVRKTALDNLMWNAVHIREELWHRENPEGPMARIRGFPGGATPEQIAAMKSVDGLRLPDWGPPVNLLWRTGPIGLVTYMMPIPEQAAFLERFDPEYLFTLPSNLRLLLAHFRDTGAKLPRLRAVWTLSERLDDDLRALCRAALGCRIVHNYTAAEAGYMALQCPSCDDFHVQSEVVHLEILDANEQPCPPGQTGRVVVTPLHNFAMPLIRYEIGDEAIFGPPCACGRGLPVLRRIAGRLNDFATLPSGAKRRVETGHYVMAGIDAIREFQLVQTGFDRIVLRLVASRGLTSTEEADIRAILIKEMGGEFAYDIEYRNELPRTGEGKLRQFVSELPESG